MKKYLVISFACALGAVSRYLYKAPLQLAAQIPWNTLIINICGAYLFAVIIKAGFDCFKKHADLRLALTAGFLGGFTTFSTVCRQISEQLSGGRAALAAAYLFLSVILGLAAAFAGNFTVDYLEGRIARSKED